VESGVDDLKEIIYNITQFEVVSMHTDLSTKTGERVMVFKLAGNLQNAIEERG